MKTFQFESRSGAVEIYAIGVDRLHIPSLTCGHHKIIGEIGAKVGKVVERRRQAGGAPSIVVLIIEDYLRSLRTWRALDHVRGTECHSSFEEPAKCAPEGARTS